MTIIKTDYYETIYNPLNDFAKELDEIKKNKITEINWDKRKKEIVDILNDDIRKYYCDFGNKFADNVKKQEKKLIGCLDEIYILSKQKYYMVYIFRITPNRSYIYEMGKNILKRNTIEDEYIISYVSYNGKKKGREEYVKFIKNGFERDLDAESTFKAKYFTKPG